MKWYLNFQAKNLDFWWCKMHFLTNLQVKIQRFGTKISQLRPKNSN